MSSAVLVDTNVPLVANGKATQAAPECVSACVDALLCVRERRCLLLDEGGLILEEYRRNLSPSGEPGAGDAFFKWLWDNQSNTKRCRTFQITADQDRGFTEFPSDPDLAGFDGSDRKFVAVALASALSPPVMNASDSDWWEHRAALKRHGVQVEFLCPELMSKG